jgi:hypothetical protein
MRKLICDPDRSIPKSLLVILSFLLTGFIHSYYIVVQDIFMAYEKDLVKASFIQAVL